MYANNIFLIALIKYVSLETSDDKIIIDDAYLLSSANKTNMKTNNFFQ